MDIRDIDSHDHLGSLRSQELSETVVHEFGYLLSLNSSQARSLSAEEAEDLDWMENWDFGKSYRSYDCISLEDSYLNRFFPQVRCSGCFEETGQDGRSVTGATGA